MKSSFYLAVTSALFLLAVSCEKEPVKIHKQSLFNSQFKSTMNENIALEDEESRILVTVKNISDKRCTLHIGCSEPGEATVRIEVSNINNSKAESMLYIGNQNGEIKETDSVAVLLDNRRYVIHLHSVNPHPSLSSTEMQTAELSVNY